MLYGYPRLTKDIDLTLGIGTDQLKLVLGVCRTLVLRVLPRNPQGFARETNVLPAEDTKSRFRIDFIFSYTPYEAQAFKRAKKVVFDGYPVKFASLEDVMVHKMIAGRAIDEEDCRNLIAKHKQKMNIKYIEKWLETFSASTEQGKLVARFRALLNQE